MNKLGSKTLILFLLKYTSVAFVLYTFLFLLLALADADVSVLIFSLFVSLGLGIFWGWLFYRNYTYAVDEKGVIIESGVINKRRVVIPYRNVQNIDMPRTLIDRILGLSRLNIQTAGDPKGYEGIIPNLDRKVARGLQEEILNLVNQAKM